ncbi:MAG: RNA polymerase sigma factor [Actinomycetota bacterium]
MDESRAALEQVYRSERDRLWRSLLAFSANPEIASDAMAEAFTQALRRGDELRDPTRWVWRAAFRIAAGELKTRRRTGAQMPEIAYEMEEPARDLIAALIRLSTNQRLAVVLHDAAGYPAREVADVIGSTPAAVRVHLMRGRRRLRELLEVAE